MDSEVVEAFAVAVDLVVAFEVAGCEVDHLVVEGVTEDQVEGHSEERVPLEQYLDLHVDHILIEGIDHIVDIIDPRGGTCDLGITVGGIIHIGQGTIIVLGTILRYILVEVLY